MSSSGTVSEGRRARRAAFAASGRIALGGLLLLLASTAFGCGRSPVSDSNEESTAGESLDQEAVSYLLRAEEAYREGQYPRALALIDSVRRDAPTTAHAPFLEARIYTRIGRFDRAATAYEEAAALDSTYEGLWFNWGNLVFRQGNYERALELYRRESGSEVRARVHTNAGRAFMNLGRTDSARARFARAITLDPENTTALGWMSELHREGGETERAIELARRMVRLRPDDVDYRYMLGSQLVQNGSYREAVPHLEQVLTRRPNHHGAHYNLGRAYVRLGRTELADVHLARADSLEQIQARVERERAYAQQHSDEAGAWLTLGRSLESLGRPSEALAAYRSARILRPRDPELLGTMARLQLETGDTSRALSTYRSILRLDPSAVNAWFNVGVVFANHGDEESARRAWERVLEYDSTDQTTRRYLSGLDGRRGGPYRLRE